MIKLPQRHLGANVIELRPGVKDSLGLRFETHDDALRHFNDIANRCLAIKRSQGCYGIDHYLRGHSYLAVQVSSGSCEFEFITARPGALEDPKTFGLGIWDEYLPDVVDQGDARKVSVLGEARDPTHDPQKFSFPMLIRFERAAGLKYGRIDPSALSFHLVFEVAHARCDGEVNIWGKRGIDLQCGIGECVIQCMANVREDVSGEFTHPPRDRLEAHAVDILTGLRVVADDDVRSILLHEGGKQGIKVSHAFFGGFE